MSAGKANCLVCGQPLVYWEEAQELECCICGKQFKGHGHNPHPIETEGVCCDECNTKVVMARIKQLEQMTEEE